MSPGGVLPPPPPLAFPIIVIGTRVLNKELLMLLRSLASSPPHRRVGPGACGTSKQRVGEGMSSQSSRATPPSATHDG